MSISPAHLARLEADQRGLYIEDFVSIAEALGEKPGNLLPNDIGTIAHVKPLVDRLADVPPPLLGQVTAILEKVVTLAETTHGEPSSPPPPRSRRAFSRKGRP